MTNNQWLVDVERWTKNFNETLCNYSSGAIVLRVSRHYILYDMNIIVHRTIVNILCTHI